jgi:hypothetical protein
LKDDLDLQDLMRIDAERARMVRITLVEGMQLLGTFDVRLREYAARKLHNQGVNLVKVLCYAQLLFCQSVPRGLSAFLGHARLCSCPCVT